MTVPPLDGIRVIDMGRWIAAPYCAMILADLGADVVKIESPAGDPSRHEGPYLDGESLYFAQMNRNKRGLTLDLRTDSGLERLHEEVREADILIENFRPGVLEQIGLGPEDLPRVNPRCIVARVSGFGQQSPLRESSAFDCILQSMSGLAAINGQEEDFPLLVGSYIVDVATAMSTAVGCLAALHERECGGRVTSVETTLLDSALALLGPWVAAAAANGTDPARAGNIDRTSAPANAYRARDGWVYIHAGPDNFWRRILKVLGREDLLGDERFATEDARIENRADADAVIASWAAERDAAEIERILADAGVPGAKVNTITEALADPRLAIAERVVGVTGRQGRELPTLLAPVRMGKDAPSVRTGLPALGAD
ncbi:MAG TPA: CoA transferase [Solirubrobacteraceae bacterium]|jgi:CoA:oxalate CoA-transferase